MPQPQDYDALIQQFQRLLNEKNTVTEQLTFLLAKKNAQIETLDEKIVKTEIKSRKQDQEKNILYIVIQEKDNLTAQLEKNLQRTIAQYEEEKKRTSEENRARIEAVNTEARKQMLHTQSIIAQKDAEIAYMTSSKFWKLRDRYLRVKHKPTALKELVQKALRILRDQGLGTFIDYTVKFIQHGRGYFKSDTVLLSSYDQWILQHEQWDRAHIDAEIQQFSFSPTISIVTPVYNVDPQWLDRCIESVLNQFYPKWELCLYDDASTKKETLECLKKWESVDSRIKITYGKENCGISLASNQALKNATGDYIALLDNDDELAPHALFENVKLLQAHPEALMIYSDEDKIDTRGKRLLPFFKPDWSPDLMHAVNYMTHLTVIKKSVGDAVGWFRKECDGAQDYDLFLRCVTEAKQKHIYHIPKILYHWRMLETSTSKNIGSKRYAHTAGVKALTDYAAANGLNATVTNGYGATNYRLKFNIPDGAFASIIIPFKDKPELLQTCVESILKKTSYPHYELLLVSNNSTEKKTLTYLESLKASKDKRIRVLEHNVPFNYSQINNWAAKQAKGNVLVLLNNDTEVISGEWLGEMISHALRPNVGAVGAKLLYPNGTIQHAGVIMGMTGLAGHIFAKKYDHATYYSLANFTRNYLAVTAACLAIEKKKFDAVGGLNEEFTVCGNDVDLGLTLYEKGYVNVYTPYAVLYHHESMTRDKIPPAGDFVVSEKRYAPYLNHNDPYYNVNLSLVDENVNIHLA